MRTNRYAGQVVAVISLCVASAGCAGLKEAVHGIAGTSTKVLEEGRSQAIAATIPEGSSSCFTRSEALLKEMGAYIYRADSRSAMIAVYVSETDTTPVGVFFTPLGNDRTEVQVTSPSSTAKQSISQKLFAGLTQPAHEPKQGEPGGAQPQLEIK